MEAIGENVAKARESGKPINVRLARFAERDAEQDCVAESRPDEELGSTPRRRVQRIRSKHPIESTDATKLGSRSNGREQSHHNFADGRRGGAFQRDVDKCCAEVSRGKLKIGNRRELIHR